MIGDLTHLPGMGPLAEALVKLPGVGDDLTLQLGKQKRQAEARAAKMKEDHDKFQSEAREQRKTAAEKRRIADQCDQRIRDLQSTAPRPQGMVVSDPAVMQDAARSFDRQAAQARQHLTELDRTAQSLEGTLQGHFGQQAQSQIQGLRGTMASDADSMEELSRNLRAVCNGISELDEEVASQLRQ